MALISFDDGTGSVQILGIHHARGNVASRFANWSPSSVSVGDRAVALSTGRVAAAFIYRTDYLVSFEIRNISPKGPSGVDMLGRAQRFCRWASNGGAFGVFVEDDIGYEPSGRAAYAAVAPTVTLANATDMLYTLSVVALSTVADPWYAQYGGARD